MLSNLLIEQKYLSLWDFITRIKTQSDIIVGGMRSPRCLLSSHTFGLRSFSAYWCASSWIYWAHPYVA